MERNVEVGEIVCVVPSSLGVLCMSAIFRVYDVVFWGDVV
jgi:hypothetical protein